jgi:hypothetical protein
VLLASSARSPRALLKMMQSFRRVWQETAIRKQGGKALESVELSRRIPAAVALLAARQRRRLAGPSVALHHGPASIKAPSRNILFARTGIEPSDVAPFHPDFDVAVDLQHKLPAIGALRRVAGESCAFRFDWILNGPRRATDLMNGFTVAEHVGILRVKALPELPIRVVLRIAPARPIVLRDESGVRRQEPCCRA